MLETYILPPVPTEVGPESLKPDVHVHILESEETYGKVAVEPLQRGFGLTIGNPLRRILLSSTNGSAITWVKIDEVVHEYTAIDGVKEEVMELLLNVKRIRIRAQSERAGKMRLDVTGEGTVCAGDIATSSDFEIVNPELHLATLDAKDSHLSIEFNVEQGVGYQPAPQGDGTSNPPVGVLPVDAIFSPVRKVNYNVERTRVGQITDYERLVLEVWTDGTIKPVDAVRAAADNLVNHFYLFAGLVPGADLAPERPLLSIPPDVYQMPIERLDLSPRTLNCLKRAHLAKVGEVLEMHDDDLLKIRNFGEKSLLELREKLAERNISPHREGGAVEALPSGEPSTGSEPLEAVTGLSPGDIDDLMGTDETSLGATEGYGNGAQSTDIVEDTDVPDDEDDEDWPDDADDEEELPD